MAGLWRTQTRRPLLGSCLDRCSWTSGSCGCCKGPTVEVEDKSALSRVVTKTQAHRCVRHVGGGRRVRFTDRSSLPVRRVDRSRVVRPSKAPTVGLAGSAARRGVAHVVETVEVVAVAVPVFDGSAQAVRPRWPGGGGANCGSSGAECAVYPRVPFNRTPPPHAVARQCLHSTLHCLGPHHSANQSEQEHHRRVGGCERPHFEWGEQTRGRPQSVHAHTHTHTHTRTNKQTRARARGRGVKECVL
jgi:hypothetical protein